MLHRLLTIVIIAFLNGNAFAQADDPLNAIAQQTSELDTSVVEQLQQLKQQQYANSSVPWQMRWHLLRCEQAHLSNDQAVMQQQLQQLQKFTHPGANSAVVMALCQANLYRTQGNIEQLQQLIINSLNENSSIDQPELLAALLMKLGMNQPLATAQPLIIDNLTKALATTEQQPNSNWLVVQPALLHFGIARALNAQNNFPSAQLAMERALASARSHSPLKWFIQYHYAVMLEQHGLLGNAYHQLQQLSDHNPSNHIINYGDAEIFRAEVAYQVKEFDSALQHTLAAIDAFNVNHRQYQLDLALLLLGKIKLSLGDKSGWESIDNAKKLLKQDGRLAEVAAAEKWSANYLASEEKFARAFRALSQYTDLQKSLTAAKREQTLVIQQQRLNEQLDNYRQQLAISADAEYQSQQSLLRWKGYALSLTLLIMVFAMWRMALRYHHNSAPTPSSDAQLTEAIQRAKDKSDPMPMMLVRVPQMDLNGDRILRQLTQDLRPQDLCLQLTAQDFLVLYPFATDGELAWRKRKAAAQLDAIVVSHYQIGTTRLNPFDDEQSIIKRLEYALASQHARAQSLST